MSVGCRNMGNGGVAATPWPPFKFDQKDLQGFMLLGSTSPGIASETKLHACLTLSKLKSHRARRADIGQISKQGELDSVLQTN